jgi:hypothetical protein
MDPDRIRAPWHFPLVLSQTVERQGRFTRLGCAARQTRQSLERFVAAKLKLRAFGCSVRVKWEIPSQYDFGYRGDVTIELAFCWRAC